MEPSVNGPLLDLGKPSKKKNYEILDIVQNSETPPLGWYGRIKYGRLALVQTFPPPYQSLDILTFKVWMYKIMVWENSDQ